MSRIRHTAQGPETQKETNMSKVIPNGGGFSVLFHGSLTSPCFNCYGAASAYLDALLNGRKPEY